MQTATYNRQYLSIKGKRAKQNEKEKTLFAFLHTKLMVENTQSTSIAITGILLPFNI